MVLGFKEFCRGLKNKFRAHILDSKIDIQLIFYLVKNLSTLILLDFHEISNFRRHLLSTSVLYEIFFF